MGEFWVEILVGLPVLPAYYYVTSNTLRGRIWPGLGGTLLAALFLGQIAILNTKERHPPDPNALQNTHTAIIGKLRAELDECREEK